MHEPGRTIEPIPEESKKIAAVVVDAALTVHRALGPGLLESVYETCLCHELALREIPFQRQVAFPIANKGVNLEAGLRIDLVVDDRLIVELKSVEQHNALFEAQLLTYLKLTGYRLGLLINFNGTLLKDGLKRLAL